MNTASRSPSEKIFAEFLQWMEQGRKISSQFRQLGQTVPAELNNAVGNRGNTLGPSSMEIPVPPPHQPGRPSVAGDDWICIPASEVFARTLVLAILNDGECTLKELHKRVKRFLPKTSEGTLYNIGSQLDGTVIKRTDNGWSLIGAVTAPVLSDNHIWGPPSVFQKQDLASHRREAIVHLLTMHPNGLRVVPILKMLGDASWMKAPISKDLLKEDFKVLERERQARQLGSKNWTVFGPQGERMKNLR